MGTLTVIFSAPLSAPRDYHLRAEGPEPELWSAALEHARRPGAPSTEPGAPGILPLRWLEGTDAPTTAGSRIKTWQLSGGAKLTRVGWRNALEPSTPAGERLAVAVRPRTRKTPTTSVAKQQNRATTSSTDQRAPCPAPSALARLRTYPSSGMTPSCCSKPSLS